MPLLQTLSINSATVGNRYIGQAILAMREGIERGEALTRTASASGLFTPLVLQMMAVGEETGALDDLFVEVADFYEQEVDYDLKQLADAIEPILIVAMGIMVLVLALGVFFADVGTGFGGQGWPLKGEYQLEEHVRPGAAARLDYWRCTAGGRAAGAGLEDCAGQRAACAAGHP